MPVIRSLLIAFSTYSRIPVPQVEWNEENRRYSMCFFPLVGLVLGLLVWGWLALCAGLRIGPFLQGRLPPCFPCSSPAESIWTVIWIPRMRLPPGSLRKNAWRF